MIAGTPLTRKTHLQNFSTNRSLKISQDDSGHTYLPPPPSESLPIPSKAVKKSYSSHYLWEIIFEDQYLTLTLNHEFILLGYSGP